MKTTFEFCIFELDLFQIRIRLENLALNWQFWHLGPNFPQKGHFWSETKKVNIIIKIFEGIRISVGIEF